MSRRDGFVVASRDVEVFEWNVRDFVAYHFRLSRCDLVSWHMLSFASVLLITRNSFSILVGLSRVFLLESIVSEIPMASFCRDVAQESFKLLSHCIQMQLGKLPRLINKTWPWYQLIPFTLSYQKFRAIFIYTIFLLVETEDHYFQCFSPG